MTTKEETIKEWLDAISKATVSTERDSLLMQNLLRRVGFPVAVVVCGVVYLDGEGTPEAPPTDIHTVARMILGVERKGRP